MRLELQTAELKERDDIVSGTLSDVYCTGFISEYQCVILFLFSGIVLCVYWLGWGLDDRKRGFIPSRGESQGVKLTTWLGAIPHSPSVLTVVPN
jgi:hypothetical protein